MTDLDKVMAKIENKVQHYKSRNLEAREALAGIEDEVETANRILDKQKQESKVAQGKSQAHNDATNTQTQSDNL